MGVLTYVAGWDHQIIGTASLTITDNSGGPFSVDFTTGTYSHTTMASVTLTSGFTAFATALATALNASGTARTYTVGYAGAPSAPSYTISVNAGTTTITFPATSAGTLMRRILGFSATTGAAASHSSDQRPYYAIAAAQGASTAFGSVNTGGPSDDSGPYEPDGVAAMSTADSGATYLISRTAAPTFQDWSQRFETKRATHTYAAASTIPWTWEHFIKHLRDGNMPFLTSDTGSNVVQVWRLRGDGASFKPAPEVADFDDYWRVDIRAVLQGRV